VERVVMVLLVKKVLVVVQVVVVVIVAHRVVQLRLVVEHQDKDLLEVLVLSHNH